MKAPSYELSDYELSEVEAAGYFVLDCSEKSKAKWHDIKDILKEYPIKDEAIGQFDFFLATVGFSLPAVNNLFAKDVANRLIQYTKKCVHTNDEYGEYALSEINNYNELSTNYEDGENPIALVCGRLIYRLIGDRIKELEVVFNGVHTGVISPVTVIEMSSILVPMCGFWKHVKSNHKLLP